MDHRDVPVPRRLAKRPLDSRGYLITYVTFISPKTKQPDFRIVDHNKVMRCANNKWCGLCGERLSTVRCFIGGPESVTNRMFSDPPMHMECAQYAMKVCPYLRSPKGKHADVEKLTAIHGDLIENPLAGTVRPDKIAIYSTKIYRVGLVAAKPGDRPSICFHVGKPTHIEWFD